MDSTPTVEPGGTGQAPPVRKAWARRWSPRKVLGLALLALGVFAAYEYLTLPEAEPLLKQNPETTALIDQREAEAREAGRKPRRRQHWVALSSVPKHVVDAVLLSEDAGFYAHEGVDRAELEKALKEAVRERRLGRGASTITQQLAKNLWLSTDRSLLRKAKELVLARRLEKALPKSRILTLYLNVAEWGSGVYGIEAGAREHFGVSASRLTVAQGALLAAMLPAPRKRAPSSGSKALKRRALWIVDQMQAFKRLSTEQAEAARVEVEQRLSGKGSAEDSAEEDDDL